MARSNAAEAWQPQEDPKDDDIEQLPQDLLKAEPPPLPESETQKALREMREAHDQPTEDTKEALATLKELADTRDAHLAAEERKKIMETRDAAATERMKRAMGASPLRELPPEDVVMEGEWTPPAGTIQDKREYMPATPPPIPKDAKKPSLLKRIGKWFRG